MLIRTTSHGLIFAVGGTLLLAGCAQPDITSNPARGASGGSAGGGAGGAPGVSADRPSLDPTAVAPDAGATAPPACGFERHSLDRVPAEVLLVFDRSGSMIENPAVEGGAVTRWDEAVPAVDGVIASAPDGLRWGLQLYPSDDECGVAAEPDVPLAAAAVSHAGITAALRDRPPLFDKGRTPTRAAVESATAHLRGRPPGGPKFILLVTDGEPNCAVAGRATGDAMGTEAAVAAAAAAGIPTFVVGIATAGSRAHETLNSLAIAGGRALDSAVRYHSVERRAELAAALGTIAGQAISCSFSLAQMPPSADDVAVDIDGRRVARDPSGASGWEYGPDRRSVVLSGSQCEAVRRGDVKDVRITFGCPGMVIP